jgi:crotonobetainyl-CoA:carnitine CoA-transferase CaiB-like acyl-CoA transferase
MTLALAGTTVVQDGASIAIAFAGRVLASYGAEVVEVATAHDKAPTSASGQRQAEYLAQGKQITGIDIERPEGAALFARLIGAAGIVLTSRTLDEYRALAERAGSGLPLVLVSVTPWGSEGPPVMQAAGDLLEYHGGGLGSITPRFANNPAEPPLRLGFPLAEFLTGLNAAVSALAALTHARVSGEPATVDVSGQQAIAFAMGMYLAFPSYEGRAVTRVSRPELAPYHFLPCKDGWIMVICPEQHQWQSLVELMGSPDWAQSEVFDTSGGRALNWDAIEPFLIEWLKDWTANDVFHAAQARRIALAPVSGMDALLASEQLAHRSFFAPGVIDGRKVQAPGIPFHSEPPIAVAPTTPAAHESVRLPELLGISESEAQALRAAGVLW